MANLGCLSVGPFFESSDPKTTVTFESIAFRKLILQVASEEDVCVRDHDRSTIIPRLRALKAVIEEGVLRNPGIAGDPPIILKHPLSCLIIRELAAVFDAKFIFVERDLQEIEKTRERRRWAPHFGSQGAEKIYPLIDEAKAAFDIDSITVNYSDMVWDPVPQAMRLVEHFGLALSESEIGARVGVVINHPNARIAA